MQLIMILTVIVLLVVVMPFQIPIIVINFTCRIVLAVDVQSVFIDPKPRLVGDLMSPKDKGFDQRIFVLKSGLQKVGF